MKVIDLLNKVASDELEDGFKFIDENFSEWKYLRSEKRFCEINFATTDNVDGLNYHTERYFIPQKLNDEIEIIEEDKEIKSIDSEYFYTNDTRYNELIDEIALNRELIIELMKESDR